MLDELVKFAKEYHQAYRDMPDATLKQMFEVYKDTTLVWQENGKIKGFAIYQDWPDRFHFIVIAGNGSRLEHIKAIRKGLRNLSAKKISYFSEKKMELIELCRQPPQDG